MLYFYETLFILAALIFTLAMFAFVTRGPNRKISSVVVSPEVAQRHRGLIYLIRGTGVSIAGVAMLAAIYFSIHCIVGALRGGTGTLGWPGVFIAVAIMVGVLGLISYVGYCNWLRVDTTAVANFAFAYAMLVAVAWYHLLPANLPKVVIDYCWDNPFFYPFREANPNPSYRALLSYLAFYVFYKLVKAYLIQVLEMNPSASAQNLPPDDPETPEFPQRSPLVQL